MNWQVIYAKEAKKSLEKYRKSNPQLYKKVMMLVDELYEHPREGSGHPKPLVNSNMMTYSRRISDSDRLIYDINDDIVLVMILSMEGHYDDK